MAAGIACAVVALLGLIAMTEPPPGPDPVRRIALAEMAPPPVDAIAPEYALIADLQAGVRPFGLIGRFLLSHSDLLAAPTGSVSGISALPPTGGQPAIEPPADLARPAPGAASASVPHVPLRDAVASAPMPVPQAPVQPSGLPAATPVSTGVSVPVGPAHFLQGGYFAERRNALDFAAALVEAGLPVRIEQAANQTGRPRWIVLVGPYAETQSALGARSAAPGLLGEAFAVQRRD